MHILDTHFRLKPFVGERHVFAGEFQCYGSFQQGEGTIFTVCILNVEALWLKTIVAGHIWLYSNKEWDLFHIERGDTVYFEATVVELENGKLDLRKTRPLYVRDCVNGGVPGR